MADSTTLYERERDADIPDPDAIPVAKRRISTQPYDLVVKSLVEQIKDGIIFLRPLSDRPSFQRNYVWNDVFASRLIESILLNVPIPPCYLSQNEDYEFDVIDGQQRLYSIYRFIDNQFALKKLEVLEEYSGSRFHQLPPKTQRQIHTHTLRLVAITNDSHPEIKFDVFQRLNSNTAPLNAQELRNCVYRGALNDLLKLAVMYEPWLEILNRKSPDKRMRDEELVLRFFGFHIGGIESYRTPQKHWLNDVAKEGSRYTAEKIDNLFSAWTNAVDTSLVWFSPTECFRRGKSRAVNRSLFDLVMIAASSVDESKAGAIRGEFRRRYLSLLENEEFEDLVSRAVDHTKRTRRRFEMWNETVGLVF